MSGDELSRLLRVKAQSMVEDLQPDTEALIARARTSRRNHALAGMAAATGIAVAAVALLSGGREVGTVDVATGTPSGTSAPEVPGDPALLLGDPSALVAPTSQATTTTALAIGPTTSLAATSTTRRPPAATTTLQPRPSTSPPVSTLPAPPVPPPVTGAPRFISMTGDRQAGRVTTRFDRPVVPGTVNLAPLYLVVHAAGDSSCSSPNGNAHEYLAGMGTDTITTDASSLVAGTTYVSIASGFVKNAGDGTENERVLCVAIAVSG